MLRSSLSWEELQLGLGQGLDFFLTLFLFFLEFLVGLAFGIGDKRNFSLAHCGDGEDQKNDDYQQMEDDGKIDTGTAAQAV